jgi:hypothetical protein
MGVIRTLARDETKMSKADEERATRWLGDESWRAIYAARLRDEIDATAREEYVNLMRYRLEQDLGYRWTYRSRVAIGARPVRASWRPKRAVSSGLQRMTNRLASPLCKRETARKWAVSGLQSGGGGIRTLDGPKRPITVFETAAFNHSATPPDRRA